MRACYLLDIVEQLCIYWTVKANTVELNTLEKLAHRDRDGLMCQFSKKIIKIRLGVKLSPAHNE